MIVINGGRGTGKTTRLIMLAASTNSIIVTHDAQAAKNIMVLSKEIGYPVEAVSAHAFFDERYRGKKTTNILIDELDAVLEGAFGVNVIASSIYGATSMLDIPDDEADNNVISLKRQR